MRLEIASRMESIDVPGNVRAEMGRNRITASDLSRWFGGAVTYWTRRITGQQAFAVGDLEAVALACEIHPAELMGGEPPAGWAPVPFDRSAPVTRQSHTPFIAGSRMLLRAEPDLQRSA